MNVDPSKNEDTGKTPVVQSTSASTAITSPAQTQSTSTSAQVAVTKSAPATSGQLPSVGRIVHYVLPEGNYPGEHRPAIIVKVWGDESGNPQPDSLVNLQIFTDNVNDFITAHPGGSGILWRTSVHRDEDTKEPGTYHFPERV